MNPSSFALSTLFSIVLGGLISAQISIVATTPTMNAANVERDEPVVIDFDRAVDPATLSAIRLYHPVQGPRPLTITLLNGGTRVVARSRTPAASDSRAVWLTISHDLRGLDGSQFRTEGFATSWTIRAAPSRFTFGQVQSFTVSHTGQARLYGGQACDLNGDDFADIATICEDTGDVRVFPSLHDATGRVGLMLGSPNPVGLKPSPNDTADLNGDGNIDVVTCNIDGNNVSILLGNGDGTFQPSVPYSMGTWPHGLALLDADADGDVDVATANTTSDDIALRLNNGDGTFAAPTFFDSGVGGEYGLAAAEMNNDGIVDLVVGARYLGHVAVLLGRGDGTFNPQPPYAVPAGVWMITCGDIDGDQRIDVAIADGFSLSGTTLYGDGNGSFNGGFVHQTNGLTTASDLGDLDGDGDLDWVLSCFGISQWLAYENDGAGHFTLKQTFSAPSNPGCATIVDIDGDFDLDLVLLDETSDTVEIWENGVQDRVTFCTGDGSATACPCANNGLPGHGCAHSFDAGGSLFLGSGLASVGQDSFSLHALRVPLGASALFFQGDGAVNNGAGTPFGDGLRCAGGFVIRLGIRQMLSDHVGFGFGFPGDPAISAAGLIPGPGAVRYYQAWFRNIAPFCTGSLFNLTNGVRVTWTP